MLEGIAPLIMLPPRELRVDRGISDGVRIPRIEKRVQLGEVN